MQTNIIKGLAVSALALGLLAAIQPASAATPQGIRNTRHNLGAGTLGINATTGTRDSIGLANGGGLGDVFSLGTDEVCVFCHTPHGTNTGIKAPLWNKKTPAQSIYAMYASGGTMNSVVPTNLTAAANMSIACLSCHDGTQAMDNMINAPGQGGYNDPGVRLGDPAAAKISSQGTDHIALWSMGNNQLGGVDQAYDNVANGDVANGVMQSTAGVDYIGTDLSNDHPIGIAYGGGNCTVGSVGATGTCDDKDFNAPQAGLNSYFQVGSATPGAKTAMRLYGTDVKSATVECASCHDPHSDTNNTFLRVSNAGSGVCLTCHAK